MDLRARLRGSGLTIATVAGTAVVAGAVGSLLLRGRSSSHLYDLFVYQNGPSAVVLLWMAWLVLRRQPRHGAGTVLLAIGALEATHVAVVALLDARLMAAGIDLERDWGTPLVPAELPLDAAILFWLMGVVWVPAAVFAMTLLPLVFPDGDLPSRRWRWVVAAAVAGAVLIMTAFGHLLWPTSTRPDDADLTAVEATMLGAGGAAVVIAVAASLIALIRRWRRSEGARRRQFRAVGAMAIGFAVVGAVTYPWQWIWIPAVLVGFNALLVAYAVAAARYRLHDLEPVLGRAAVATVLAAVVTAVYLAIVVGAGSLVGRGIDDPLLPLLAVGIVALLIEPARRRTRIMVDRLLYGRRADRTEVLSRLAARASESTAEDVLDDVAELLVRGTGATRAEVWLQVESQARLAASAGHSDETAPALRTVVVHHGERLGELRVYSRAAADLVRDAEPLLDDVAYSLGVVLRNARLTAQLRAQLDELRSSRQRLVEVHDATRRELERDIHDGAQSRLIALRLRLGVARALADTDDRAALREQLDALGPEVDSAVRSLRELARGLHPPILEQSGVAAALRAHMRALPVAVTVTADSVGRYQRIIEGALYFACLEAVQNAVRHAHARRIWVHLDSDDEMVRFCVRDDGAGFDAENVLAGAGITGAGLANIDDRVSALGGTTRVFSAPGRGTRISGEVPAQTLVEDR